MRTLAVVVLAVVLAVLSILIPAVHAQDVTPSTAGAPVPPAEVIDKVQPFLGDWNAVVCETKPYGVRFGIRLDTVKDENGKDQVTPIFHLVAVQIMDIGNPFDFITEAFREAPGKDIKWIIVTNNQLELALISYPDKTSLALEVGDDNGGFSEGIAEKGDDAKDPWAYVENLAKSCPATEAPKSASNRTQVASR